MKERFEGLSAWKEKQKEEREFLEKRLEEAKARLSTVDAENETLKKRVQEMEKSGAEVRRGGHSESIFSCELNWQKVTFGLQCVQSELETLKGQIARLQAEKNDLVALNSELQLKMGQGSPRDSFIEIRIAVSAQTHFCVSLGTFHFCFFPPFSFILYTTNFVPQKELFHYVY